MNGGCFGNKDHSSKHFLLTQHPLVLNFKNVLKKKADINESESNKKDINKIAIGKEGGADFASQDEYEIHTELKCLVCKLSLTSEPIKNLAESIIKAETSFVKSGLVAWELEIKPCNHIKNLVQNPATMLAANGLP